MFQNIQNKYLIEMSSTTPQEVIEWFEIMNNCNTLSEALIDLVHREIKTTKDIQTPEVKNEVMINKTQNTSLETNFISSIYNWQDSTAAIFSDATIPKNDKKKMLSI